MTAADLFDPIPKEQRDLALWAFPLVSDFTQARYAAQTKLSEQGVRAAAFNHSHFWRALILRDHNNAQKFRAALERAVSTGGVPKSFVAQLDEALLDELMVVVSERFRRCPRQALELNHILLQLARDVTSMRYSREMRV